MEQLGLRLFIDGSALEIFTSTGQALTTRLYRGRPELQGQQAAGECCETLGVVSTNHIQYGIPVLQSEYFGPPDFPQRQQQQQQQLWPLGI